MKKHQFAFGLALGAAAVAFWYNRGIFLALPGRFRRFISHPLAGADLIAAGSADSNVHVRQIRRYTFASMQDKSPIVGLTHASYALVLLDTLEETVGRDAIKRAGYDPVAVRQLITKLQDKHAEALRACDTYLQQVMALERGGNTGALQGFAMSGGAPMGA